MQPQDLESVTTVEPNEQIDARERQPYQAPCFEPLNISETLADVLVVSDGAVLS
jgi:hypothetical protein